MTSPLNSILPKLSTQDLSDGSPKDHLDLEIHLHFQVTLKNTKMAYFTTFHFKSPWKQTPFYSKQILTEYFMSLKRKIIKPTRLHGWILSFTGTLNPDLAENWRKIAIFITKLTGIRICFISNWFWRSFISTRYGKHNSEGLRHRNPTVSRNR